MTHNAGIGIASAPIAAGEAGLGVPVTLSPIMGIGCIAGSPIAASPLAASRPSNEVSQVIPVVPEAALVGRTANGVPGGVRNFDPTEKALARKKRKPRRWSIDVGSPETLTPPIEQAAPTPEASPFFGDQLTHFTADAAKADFYVSSIALLSRLVENLAAPSVFSTAQIAADKSSKSRSSVVPLRPLSREIHTPENPGIDEDDEAAIAIILALAA